MRKPNRREIWRHNSFRGHAAMMLSNTRSITDSKTATHESKTLARQIAALSLKLSKSLRTRVDQEKK